jgi:hypothetical protein
MSNESFNWKSLFIQEEIKDPSKPIANIIENKPIETTKFPSQENKFPSQTSNTVTTNSVSNNSNNSFINEILDVYQKGFDSLNQENYDFFEFYKSIVAVGINNPQSYQMAYTMGKSIKSDLTKDFLLEKSKFYISEIEKVYTKYDSAGNNKKNDFIAQKNQQNSSLTKSIYDLEIKMVELQIELEVNKIELTKLESNFAQPIQETNLKIEANNIAKKTILDSIQNVINGINQYL